jgi:CRISPR-associated protein Cas6/Cse3/CasE subtype I-E
MANVYISNVRINDRAIAPVVYRRAEVDKHSHPSIISYGLSLVVTTNTALDGKTRKVDVVMHALHPLSPEQRRGQREEVTHAAYLDWMQRQGEAHGFAVEHEVFQVIAHYRERIPRRGAAPIFINCGELVGMLKVTDPDALRRCLVDGLGASRSFGCGLLEVAHVH